MNLNHLVLTLERFLPKCRDLYVNFVILGHSERRQFYGETNQSINKKILATIENNLKPIYCIENH